MRKLLVMAATSFAIAAAPTIASAQQAPSPARAAEVQPASEEVDGSAIRLRGGFILPLLLVVGIILALLLTIDEETQDFPTSP